MSKPANLLHEKSEQTTGFQNLADVCESVAAKLRRQNNTRPVAIGDLSPISIDADMDMALPFTTDLDTDEQAKLAAHTANK